MCRTTGRRDTKTLAMGPLGARDPAWRDTRDTGTLGVRGHEDVGRGGHWACRTTGRRDTKMLAVGPLGMWDMGWRDTG